MARLKDYVIFFKCRNAGDIVEPMEFKLSALNADDARRKGYKILDIDKFTILKAKPLLKIEREKLIKQNKISKIEDCMKK